MKENFMNINNIRKIFFPALLLVLFFAVSSLSILTAQKKKTDNTQCLSCHSAPGFTKTTPKGEKSLTVNEADLKSSVHKKLKCTSCHSNMQPEHPGKPAPEVNCTQCHFKGNKAGAPDITQYNEYKDSVHGKGLKKGSKDVPTCKDCHGTHNIKSPKDPKSTVYHLNIPDTCAKCHEDKKLIKANNMASKEWVEQYKHSVHGIALTEKGLVVTAVCTNCHGVHTVKPITKADIPEVCGKCHEGVYEKYMASFHGQALKKGIAETPVCTDCHGEHNIQAHTEKGSKVFSKNIPATCSRCHADIAIVNKYGLDAKKFASYEDSFHGIALKYGDVTVANCASCHGYHDILPSSDPRSSISKNNIPKTCGKCHPGVTENIAKGSVHVQPSPKHDKGVFYVRLFYIVFISTLITLFVLYIILDLIGRIRRKSRKNKGK
ncbi:MAG: cytochrome c3 family protein [Firmicutes bacterium]|nr:cytochrome c3 family protein [Bacillota bacterium]